MLRWISRSAGAAGSHFRSLLGNAGGASAIEFALIAPVFLAMGVGALKFGVVLSQYMLITNAAAAGATTFALSRGTDTAYAATGTAITNAAPSLTAGSVTKTLSVNGTACTDNNSCKSALVAGATATVRVTYPCDINVLGHDFFVPTNGGPQTCTLSATSAQMVQ